MLLRGPLGGRASDNDDVKALTALCKSLRSWAAAAPIHERQEDTFCARAICAILTSDNSTLPSRHALDESTLVDTAIYSGQTGLIHVLLDLGVSVDEPGLCHNGYTMLQRLCQCAATKSVVKEALSRTNSVQARTADGDTLLHLPLRSFPQVLETSIQVIEDIVNLLVDTRLDINAISSINGTTPLMQSSYFSPEITGLLLEHNADASVRDHSGRDAVL